MYQCGFPQKFLTIIQQPYEDATCQVIHSGKLAEPFNVQPGVRQATAGKRTGIQWTLDKQLEDPDYADDISLLYHTQQHAQEKLCRINIKKTETMRVNNRQQDPVRLHQVDIKDVDSFVTPSSVVSKDGVTDEDIKR
uniref:Reverse transcriptase domain-containing protein n=1 Tax=Octopus bimaculoides TaxID=37653 RepID=A0A0L8I2G0_OCTBM